MTTTAMTHALRIKDLEGRVEDLEAKVEEARVLTRMLIDPPQKPARVRTWMKAAKAKAKDLVTEVQKYQINAPISRKAC